MRLMECSEWLNLFGREGVLFEVECSEWLNLVGREGVLFEVNLYGLDDSVMHCFDGSKWMSFC